MGSDRSVELFLPLRNLVQQHPELDWDGSA
jgi:hypothetical protein